MTPDQLISTMHRQRTDQIAMRLALTDLANVLPPALRREWLSALQSRIANNREAADQLQDKDQRDGLIAATTALEFLHRGLSAQAGKEATGG